MAVEVSLQATNGGRGVEEGEPLFLAERHNLVYLETLGLEVHEVILVTKEYLSLQSPVVVDIIRIKKVHAPPLALGREATQEQHLRMLRQEGLEWVVLYPISAAGNILCV